MDSYIRILCRLQKCKQNVPPPSLLKNEKSPFTPPKEDFRHPFGDLNSVRFGRRRNIG
jgi:hypothetical protein